MKYLIRSFSQNEETDMDKYIEEQQVVQYKLNCLWLSAI